MTQSKKMTWRWIATGVALVTIVAIGTHIVRQGPTPARVERMVRSEVPLGSTQESVVNWLNQRSIEFVGIKGTPNDYIGHENVMGRADFAKGQTIQKTIRAYIAPAFVSVVWSGEVRTYFFFDPEDQLIGYAFVPWSLAL